jgi:hypothetical protein
MRSGLSNPRFRGAVVPLFVTLFGRDNFSINPATVCAGIMGIFAVRTALLHSGKKQFSMGKRSTSSLLHCQSTEARLAGGSDEPGQEELGESLILCCTLGIIYPRSAFPHSQYLHFLLATKGSGYFSKGALDNSCSAEISGSLHLADWVSICNLCIAAVFGSCIGAPCSEWALAESSSRLLAISL